MPVAATRPASNSLPRSGTVSPESSNHSSATTKQPDPHDQGDPVRHSRCAAPSTDGHGRRHHAPGPAGTGLPAILAHWWYFGPGIFFPDRAGLQALPCCSKPPCCAPGNGRVRLFLGDYKRHRYRRAVLPCACPPLSPWWVAATGMLFAIVIAKHLYGWSGVQPVQSCDGGFRRRDRRLSVSSLASGWLRAQSHPACRTCWKRDEGDRHWRVCRSRWPGMPFPQATPLDILRTGVQDGLVITEIRGQPIFGDFRAAWAGNGSANWVCTRRSVAWSTSA